MPERFSDIVVDVAKLRDYCLSDSHPRGRHKARVFRSRLGLIQADAELLRVTLLDAARSCQGDLRRTGIDHFGERYMLELRMSTTAGTATIRSSWIVLTGQDVLRFVSCYVV